MRRLIRPPAVEVRPVGRRIKVNQYDTLIIANFEIDAEILSAVLDPDNRVLWAFVHGAGGKVQPTAYNEEHCIWLEQTDIDAGIES